MAKGKSADNHDKGTNRSAERRYVGVSERGTPEKVADNGQSSTQLVPRSVLTFQPGGIGIVEKLSVTAFPRPICVGPYG